MKRWQCWSLLALVMLVGSLALVACGDDPVEPVEQVPPDISGTWTYSTTTLTSNTTSWTCELSGTLSVQQAAGATSFSGVMSGQDTDCVGPNPGDITADQNGGDVIDATVSVAGAVEFNIGDASYHHEGTVAGSGGMSGTVTLVQNVGLPPETHTFTGSWSASR